MKKSQIAADALNGFLFGLTEVWNEDQELTPDELSALCHAYDNVKKHLTPQDEKTFCKNVLAWANFKDPADSDFFVRIMLGHTQKG